MAQPLSEEEQLVDDLEDLRQIASLVLNSEFENVIPSFKKRTDRSYYHLLGLTLFRTMIAGSYLDKKKFSIALGTCYKAYDMASKHRKKNVGLVFKTDPNAYTDCECHAELVCAEMLMAQAGLTIVSDTSFTGFIKGAFNLRTSFNGLKNCERILGGKSNWKNDQLRDEFNAGIKLSLGLFEMAISFMPRKFILLLEFAGFSGNRTFGLGKLETCAQISTSIRKLAAFSVVGGYYSFIEYFYCLGELDEKLPLMQALVKDWSEMYPDSQWTTVCLGFMEQLEGNLDTALTSYEVMMLDKRQPRFIHFGVYWQKCWISAVRLDWQTAFECSRVLREECSWSRSLFAYMYAAFGSMVLESEPENEYLRSNVAEALTQVPRVKRNFGGKKAFHEKIVIEKSKRFLKYPSTMILAPLDLIYLWNMFNVAATNRQMISAMIKLISTRMDAIDKNADYDAYSYLNFMKGVALSRSGQTLEASDCFQEVILKESNLELDLHLVPQSTFELGLLYRKSGDLDTARKWFRRTKRYSDYLTESMITFRSDAALKSISDAEERIMMVTSDKLPNGKKFSLT